MIHIDDCIDKDCRNRPQISGKRKMRAYSFAKRFSTDLALVAGSEMPMDVPPGKLKKILHTTAHTRVCYKSQAQGSN
jgi:hypothetical protein